MGVVDFETESGGLLLGERHAEEFVKGGLGLLSV